jgi:hypothetical protein
MSTVADWIIVICFCGSIAWSTLKALFRFIFRKSIEKKRDREIAEEIKWRRKRIENNFMGRPSYNSSELAEKRRYVN